MTDNAKIFDTIRPWLDAKGFTPARIAALDAALAAYRGEAPAPTPAPAPAPAPSGGLAASQRCLDLIHSFETLKLVSYKDPGSKNGLPITNGWGTTIDEDGGPIPYLTTWTKEKADRLFARDFAKFQEKVRGLLGSAPTTQGQFDALVSFAYNIGYGEGGLKTSTLLRMHKAGDYAGAAGQFARWNKNDGKVLNGLTRRRAAEAALYGS